MNKILRMIALMAVLSVISSLLSAQGACSLNSTGNCSQVNNCMSERNSVTVMLERASKNLEMARNLSSSNDIAAIKKCDEQILEARSNLTQANNSANAYQQQEIARIATKIGNIRFSLLQSDLSCALKGIDKAITEVDQLVYRSISNESQEASDPMLSINRRSGGIAFKAAGKQWRVGMDANNWSECQDLKTWPEAQAWIKSLGDGWRSPTRAEVRELYKSVRSDSPIGVGVVWIEAADSSTPGMVRGMCFRRGSGVLLSGGNSCFRHLALAVRTDGSSANESGVTQMPKPVLRQPASKTFEAVGKEWSVAADLKHWDGAQSFIKSLGEGWRAPTRAEVRELFKSVRSNSPIGVGVVWIEMAGSSTPGMARGMCFRSGSDVLLTAGTGNFEGCFRHQALAVRKTTR